MTVIILWKFVSKDLKGTVQMVISSPFLMLFKERQPVNVILQYYQEKGNYLKELMMVLHNMFLLLLRICTEKNILRLLSVVKGELERRFHQDNFLFVRSIEAVLISSANGRPFSLDEKFKDVYSKDIDMERLHLQLQMLPDAIKTSATKIKEVTKINAICSVLNDQPGIKGLLSEVHKLLRIYYTIPVTTASAERSFSALKRIKTYLRNSMTQQRLNHCMLLHVHLKETDQMDLNDIAKEFVRRNERRISYFGNF